MVAEHKGRGICEGSRMMSRALWSRLVQSTESEHAIVVDEM